MIRDLPLNALATPVGDACRDGSRPVAFPYGLVVSERPGLDPFDERTFRRLGRIMLGLVEGPLASPESDATVGRRDKRDHWMLRVAREDESGLRRARRDHGAGDPVLETLDAPFTQGCVTGEWVAVVFPRDLTPGLARRDPRACVGPLRSAPAHLLGRFVLELAEQLRRVRPSDLPRLAVAMRAMIVATLDEATPPPAPASRMRARVDEVILENIASARLDPARIAELLGVSRSTLYRLFEGTGGVAAHVQRLRLDCVRADLADPAKAGEPISRLAELRGFYSVTSFNRSFRAAFGMTPTEARRSAQSAARALAPVPAAGPSDGLVAASAEEC